MFILDHNPNKRIVYQQADAANGGTTWPPPSLLSAMNRTLRGSNNMDRTLNDFLDHVRTDQQQYFLERLKEYEAMLHLIGLLAGVIGTAAEQEAAQQQVQQVIDDYLAGLDATQWSIDNPIDVVSPGAAVFALIQDAFGYEDAAEQTRQSSRIVNTVEINAQLRLGQMIRDFFQSIWNALKQWYKQFWETYETEGLLIAMNRARIDVAFFVAECAIDIAITAALAGAGAAVVGALKGLRFVGMRVGRTVTRVTVQAIPDGIPNPTAIRLTHFDIVDEDIAPDIDRIMDEDRFGSGSTFDDTAERATANAATPNTSVIRGHGRNVSTVEVDPDTGRPMSVEATIMDDAGANPRGDNATEIGRRGDDGDHGGHLIAHRFMGDVPDEGIVPQAGNLNTGAWKTMENEWADWVAYGRSRGTQVEIDVRINVIPPGSVRPDRFVGRYVVYETGEDGVRRIVRQQPIRFNNQSGETFNRIYFRTDSDGRMIQR